MSYKVLKDTAIIVEIICEQLILLINHLIAMLKRISNMDIFLNPFHNETKAIYVESFAVCERLSINIYERIGIHVSEAEISFMTLYIHNLLNEEDMSQ